MYNLVIAEPVTITDKAHQKDIANLISELQDGTGLSIIINSTQSLGILEDEYGITLRPKDQYVEKSPRVEEILEAVKKATQKTEQI